MSHHNENERLYNEFASAANDRPTPDGEALYDEFARLATMERPICECGKPLILDHLSPYTPLDYKPHTPRVAAPTPPGEER